jgi:hypothetical protein
LAFLKPELGLDLTFSFSMSKERTKCTSAWMFMNTCAVQTEDTLMDLQGTEPAGCCRDAADGDVQQLEPRLDGIAA